MSRKPKIHKNKKGEYIKQTYFVNGKRKFQKIYVIDGIPADEYYEKHADIITLHLNGDHDIIYTRQMKEETEYVQF